MKIYSTVCVGLLVIFLCEEPKTKVVSDFCQGLAVDVEKLKGLTDAEIKALSRPKKEAILSIRRKYKANCQSG